MTNAAAAAVDRVSLHPDAEAALTVWARHAHVRAERARRSIERLLFPFPGAHAEPGPRWGGSRLTGDGYPLEFVFVFDSDRLRYTLDPIVAGCAPRDALRCAMERVSSPGPLAAPLLRECAAAQEDADLRYGAWIGGSHDDTTDRDKFYVEAPALLGRAATGEARSAEKGVALGTAWPLPEPVATLRMIGVETASGAVELYWRTSRLGTHHLARALAAWGWRHRAADVVDFIAHAYGHPLDGNVPGSPAGLSLAMTAAGEPTAATLFLFARTLWGGDANIRRRLRALTAGTMASAVYEELTAPLAVRDTWQTCHGVLGLTVSGDAPLRVSVGLRPPPASGGPAGSFA